MAAALPARRGLHGLVAARGHPLPAGPSRSLFLVDKPDVLGEQDAAERPD